MSKRSRRYRNPNIPAEALNPVQPVAIDADGTPVQSPAATQAAIPASLAEEYGEVLGDLRRTFVIFIAMAAAMLALSFVIR